MGQSRKNEKESNKTKQNRAKEINVRIKKEWGKRKIWETREYIQTKNKGESKKKKKKEKKRIWEKEKNFQPILDVGAMFIGLLNKYDYAPKKSL